ncbi:hypothetical protein FE257_006939 [Aspergillus nanangensis]|uniref:Major facilitator superfamily (MFS) profile domain-containing protein n=1 Tax=Aspergillus nanangensis TaxID=2582783 RepID=A0AAD4CNL9_ASPNN|nr:hypothetical protein FE257_006939 [Aspergillus nanangensis]
MAASQSPPEEMNPHQPSEGWWRRKWFRSSTAPDDTEHVRSSKAYRPKTTLGILSDKETDQVPGTVLLLSSNRNEPLGMRHQPQRTSASSLPQYPPSRSSSRTSTRSKSMMWKKKTADGQIVLEPQPDDSVNDPLNWPIWRRDVALVSLGFYCLMGGGMTPILAAGFNQVADTYNVTTQQVAFTTGLYMLGLGVGSVVMSPTAILFGKRPVYLLGATLFILSAIWCAASPNYPSLVVARVFQGIAVSPVECLPSATIAEIFFLHERAYRVGIYTLLLLGGKNLIPLVSAAIIGNLGWRWVFWVVAMIVGACLVTLFFFVPETIWDRTPRARQSRKRPGLAHRSVSDIMSHGFRGRLPHPKPVLPDPVPQEEQQHPDENDTVTTDARPKPKKGHVGFVGDDDNEKDDEVVNPPETEHHHDPLPDHATNSDAISPSPAVSGSTVGDYHLRHSDPEKSAGSLPVSPSAVTPLPGRDIEADGRSPARTESRSSSVPVTPSVRYTERLRERPLVPYAMTLRPYNGRMSHDSWGRVAVRPFILFAYPAVLWSAVVYALSVGWLIVISELVAHIYQGHSHYNFTALQTGLVYISPFVGGLLGTAVAGKVSDVIVKMMTRRNGGVYEPEFRLVMVVPIALSTTIGLMAFGWSAQLGDHWMVPTVFFGMVSFGCCLGSTTSITFCVDSYRQYAGEALVTLNWSKNVFHGRLNQLNLTGTMEEIPGTDPDGDSD